MLKRYGKSITALLGAGAAALVAALADGSITGGEWIGIVIAVVTGGATYAAPYRPQPTVKSSIHDVP